MGNQQGTKENQGTLVNVKRVRKLTDKAGRDQIILTFGTESSGANSFEALLNALNQYQGRQVNLDVRIGKKQTEGGAEFDTAFVIVKEMIPRSQQPAQYVSKNQNRAEQVKAKADKISKQFGG